MSLFRGNAVRLLARTLLCLLMAGCVTVTTEPRAVYLEQDHQVHVERLNCAEATQHVAAAPATAPGFDPAMIRVTTWNIHKQGDKGWREDLARFGGNADLLLVQELVLRPDIRSTIEDAGLQWAMASSFQDVDIDIGVLTAARVPPIATCTQRVVEPLLRIPKSAVITWYALRGRPERLAVVNMHSINFSLSLGAYREQLDAMRDVLAQHRGPILFAGDLNTWTAGRYAAVQEVAAGLGLQEISFEHDQRRLFLGKQLDHIFVRGLDWTASSASEVTSSDHNPVHATLRLALH
jgi:endonuclease/exonuclease/phosphatase (EEP) superfamily protein YafD